MVKIKDFFHRLYLKFSFSKLGKWLFPIFLICFVPKVFAFSVAGRYLQYPTTTMGYNYATDTTWQNLPLTFGTEYQAYYTTNQVTTGTYGIAFGGLTGTTYIPGHYYSLVYAASKPSSGCKIPYSWNQIVAASSIISGNTTNRMTRVNNNMSTGYVEWGDSDAFDACIYTTTFQVSQPSQYLMLPVNSQSTEQNRWVFYGYSVIDLGLTSNLSTTDLNNMSTALQSAISSQTTAIQNALNSQTTNINNNVDQEFADLKNQDHSYNNNASDNLNGQSQLNSYDSKTNQLKNLFSTNTSNLDFTLNANATNFIWGIVSSFRSLNSKITLLISVVLSFAIVKMILNR